ncbi:lycopene cyclase family protein [Mycolicibacterium frederiksbergense]|uniref:lycopene cyclase family protein n=1 Tax=Mycolicibacterium frederiksbergense TaxID=117567 RepID=UPI0039998396
MTSRPQLDVLVVGAGPAGMALAAACGRLGLVTGLLDPSPDRPWTATYGMWSPEVPADLPASLIAARADGRAIALTEHQLGWEYAVLDVPALHRHLGDELAGVHIHTGRALGSPERGVITLADGSELRAAVVVDAGGRSRPLHPRPARGTSADQTAYGVVVDEDAAAPFTRPGDALFMDWRTDHGEPGWPTFLYAVPLGGGQVLLEETSLARRPGLPLPVLRRRLQARLARHGVRIPEGARSEKVSFPLDQPRHNGRSSLGFGAAAPLIHPATGFSVAASLHLAPPVAVALAAHLPAGPDAALAAARHIVWSRPARAIHRFRQIGLEALLRMPAEEVPSFFETFFSLPEAHRWTYLTARDDVRGTAVAMSHLFRLADGRLRRHLVSSAFRRSAPAVVSAPLAIDARPPGPA